MDITILRTVLSICHYCSFTGASEQLSLSVSAVSKHVAAAEAELGIRLFRRGTKARSVDLTDEGQSIIGEIEDIVWRYDALLKKTADMGIDQTQTLQIGYGIMLSSFGEDQILSDFCNHYPNVEVKVSSDYTTEIIRLLTVGLIDCAFAGYAEGVNISDEIRTGKGSIGCVTIYKGNDMSVLVSKTHRLAGREDISVGQLDGETLILNNRFENKSKLPSHGMEFFSQDGMTCRFRFMDFSRKKLIFNAVANGQGILPYVYPFIDDDPRLTSVRIGEWIADSYGLFLYRKNSPARLVKLLKKYVDKYASAVDGRNN